MKKVLLTTILLCAMAITAAAQPEMPRTVTSEGLRGPVRMVVTTWNYESPDSSGGYAISCSTTQTFDTAGRLTMHIEMDAVGLDNVLSYDYDAQGRITKVQSYFGEPYTETYVYAPDGRLLYTEVSYVDAFAESNCRNEVTDYDKQGRVLAFKNTTYGYICDYAYHTDGSLKSLTSKHGQREETSYYGPYGLDSVSGTKYYTYDERGNVVQTVSKWPNLNQTRKVSYSYDDYFDSYGNWKLRNLTYSDKDETFEAFERRQIIYYENIKKQ